MVSSYWEKALTKIRRAPLEQQGVLGIVEGLASWFGLAFSFSLLLVLTSIAYSFLLVLLIFRGLIQISIS